MREKLNSYGIVMEILEHLPALLIAGAIAGFFAGLLGIGGVYRCAVGYDEL